MKNLLYIIIAFGLSTIWVGCEKYADDYKKYVDNQEIIYPGLARDVRSQAGYLRAVLVWNPSPDPNIDYYMVYWNNRNNSQRVEATTHSPADSIVVSIPDLEEYVYSFTIIAYDNEGNASVGQELNNVRVYGPTYQAVLQNRAFNASQPYEIDGDGAVKLRFNAPDTLNTGTEIKYTNKDEVEKTIVLLPKDNEITLVDYKFGTDIQYRSGYVPEPNAADTLYTLSWEAFPTIIYIVQADKSLFQPLYLPNDARDEYGWILPNLWNGNTTSDQGFHTGGVGLPISFSLDIGVEASLTGVRLWQRYNARYDVANPKRFEVWGSNNPASDGNWDSWTKLGEFTNIKPSGLPRGQNSEADNAVAAAGELYEFAEPTTPFRYLRFRIIEVWNPDVNYFHLSQLSVYRLGE